MNTAIRAMGRSLGRSWAEGTRMEHIAFVVGGVLFASGLAHVVYLLATGASWVGPVSLRKAATFGLSFGLTLATVTWATHFVRQNPVMRRVLLGGFTLACVLETFLVSLQAWRGVPSHFNFQTPFDAAVAGMLAFGGLLIVVLVLAFTLSAFRGVGQNSPSMRLALRYGFVVLAAAMGIGAAMIAVGVPLSRADPQAAFDTGGFLKPAHAVTMHAILVLPGLAWLLTFTSWAESVRMRIVRLGIAGYTLVGAVVIVESIARVSPLDAPLVPTLLSLAGLLALVAAGLVACYGALYRRTVDRGGQFPTSVHESVT
ncbi:MAG TPA: hypothetical protein VH969_04170 [Actinophytocola sp.]|jgi:hypothetical protein|uniref:hypothetical protein n=1 Tax=Actinophytocola sp. TaxID=1872138 RepID=UPI002F94683C